MAKQPKTIDLTQTVMQRISHERIVMRSRRYFVVGRVAYGALLFGMAGFAVLLVLAVLWALRYAVFIEYLSAPRGAWLFVRSLPWQGVVLTVVAVVGAWASLRQLHARGSLVHGRQVLAGAAVFLLIVSLFGLVGPRASAARFLGKVAFLSAQQPVKVVGTIDIIKVNTLLLRTAEGLRYVTLAGITIELHENDEVMILGTERDGVITPHVVRVLYAADLPDDDGEKNPHAQEDVPLVSQSPATSTSVAPKPSVPSEQKPDDPASAPKAHSKPKVESSSVSVGLTLVADNVVASISTDKNGTCYFKFDKDGEHITRQASASSGGCQTPIEAGYKKVQAKYLANDGTAQGVSSWLHLP